MSARILDGRGVASRLWRDLSARVEELKERSGHSPRLATVRFQETGPSAVYAASLSRAARSVGIEPVEVIVPGSVAFPDLAARIGALNRDPTVSGIVLAQPLPAHLDAAAVLDLVEPDKDVDGATALNAGRLSRGRAAFAPATALAVMAILDAHQVQVEGRRAVVIGRSAVVGRPVASLLLNRDATVVVCHRRTRNLARETRRAEILVVAAGQPRLVRAEMVNRGAVVVDCGINTTAEGIVGDVDYAAVRPVVRAITPVPGGVGPVTTMMVLRQTIDAAERLAGEPDPMQQRFVSVPTPTGPSAEPR
ncbi:MAG TPA: bifunctional 5,10-methylenetetrahydrofolate dehydrogenase/5,10-methenyltetrahydrofolate cyclohydrolase [candidate division Zixibacteria bacterium]|nr:bifunctional 5,10-methylenetetrahydrofolate dehydrogenase/5,10-methenyltetrahydrofolate cyclohydrolase [candidate division Zixibacteria bacterium]